MIRKGWNSIVQKYVITPNDKNFKYEYSKIGLGDFKVISELDLQNPIIHGLLQRGKLNISPYHEKPQKPVIKKETKKVDNPTSNKDENIKVQEPIKDEDSNLRKDGADINAKN